jgi:hypothetical protein
MKEHVTSTCGGGAVFPLTLSTMSFHSNSIPDQTTSQLFALIFRDQLDLPLAEKAGKEGTAVYCCIE